MKIVNADFVRNYPNLTIAKENEETTVKLTEFLEWLNRKNELALDLEPEEQESIVARYLGYEIDRAKAEQDAIVNKFIASYPAGEG